MIASTKAVRLVPALLTTLTLASPAAAQPPSARGAIFVKATAGSAFEAEDQPGVTIVAAEPIGLHDLINQ